MNNGLPDRLLTELEVAEVLHISRSSVQRLRNTGRLPVVKVGERSIRFRQVDVAALMTTSEAAAS